MKISIVGTGYVGLPSGVGLAELGNRVICIDCDKEKIESLKQGNVTLYEEGLVPLFHKNLASGNLSFTTSMEEGIRDADVVILAVGTPTDPITKSADLSYILQAAEDVAKHLTKYAVICDKSTVPVGTGERIEKIIKTANPAAEFDVVSLPEFLREGFAVHDFFYPDRIVIGTESERARAILLKLYAPLAKDTKIVCVKRKSAETIKYASNAFLAMKIHYINEIADFCEKSGADVRDVALGMGLDSRIGPKFLNPGPGFGGSCFPKDTLAMDYMARARRILRKAEAFTSPKIAVLGIAFKGGTDDCRESPAVDIVKELLLLGAKKIEIFDPQALNNAKRIFAESVTYAKDVESCVKDADVLVVLTEWEEFKNINLRRISCLMKHRVIEDLRNVLNPEEAVKIGFDYSSIGRL